MQGGFRRCFKTGMLTKRGSIVEVWCRSGCVWCWLGGESHNVVECGSFCQVGGMRGCGSKSGRLTVDKKWHLVCRGSPVRSALLLLLPLPRQAHNNCVASREQTGGRQRHLAAGQPHCGCPGGWLLYRTAAER